MECACGHDLDEHEPTPLAPCTIEDCPCGGYDEYGVEDEDED